MRIFYLEESLGSAVHDESVRDDLTQLADLKAQLAAKKRHEDDLSDELRRLQKQVDTLSHVPAPVNIATLDRNIASMAAPVTSSVPSSAPPRGTPLREQLVPEHRPIEEQGHTAGLPFTPRRPAHEAIIAGTPSRSFALREDLSTLAAPAQFIAANGTRSEFPAASSPSVRQDLYARFSAAADPPVLLSPSSSFVPASPSRVYTQPASSSTAPRLPVFEPRDARLSIANHTAPVNVLHSTQDAWVPLSVPTTPTRPAAPTQLTSSFRRASHAEDELHRPLSSFLDTSHAAAASTSLLVAQTVAAAAVPSSPPHGTESTHYTANPFSAASPIPASLPAALSSPTMPSLKKPLITSTPQQTPVQAQTHFLPQQNQVLYSTSYSSSPAHGTGAAPSYAAPHTASTQSNSRFSASPQAPPVPVRTHTPVAQQLQRESSYSATAALNGSVSEHKRASLSSSSSSPSPASSAPSSPAPHRTLASARPQAVAPQLPVTPSNNVHTSHTVASYLYSPSHAYTASPHYLNHSSVPHYSIPHTIGASSYQQQYAASSALANGTADIPVGSLRPTRPAPPLPGPARNFSPAANTPGAHHRAEEHHTVRDIQAAHTETPADGQAANHPRATPSHTPSQSSEQAHDLLLYIERENQLQKEKLRRMEEDMLALELLLHTPPVASHAQRASAPSLLKASQMNGTAGSHSSSQGQRADSLPSALTPTATVNQAAEPLPHTPGHVKHQHHHFANGNGHDHGHTSSRQQSEHRGGSKFDDDLQMTFSRSERLCAELRERCQQIERMHNNVSQLDESAPVDQILPEVETLPFESDQTPQMSLNDETIHDISRVRDQARSLEDEIVAQIEQTKQKLARSQRVLESERRKFLSS